MLIHADVSGHYDWVPCPPGTVITEADHKANRVRPMANGDWHMRVRLKRDTHTDVNIPELAICDRMAALVKIGKAKTREAVVAEILTETFRHHAPTRCIHAIVVLDQGPIEELFAAELAKLDVDANEAADAMAEYLDEPNVAAYLAATFKIKPRKETK